MAFLSLLRSCPCVLVCSISWCCVTRLRRRPPRLRRQPPRAPVIRIGLRSATAGAAASASASARRFRRRPRPRSRRLPRLGGLGRSAPRRRGLGCRGLGGSLGGRRLGSAAQPRARRPLPTRLALFDQGREAVGQIARQRLEESGQLLHRGRQRTGDTGQEHVAGREVGQCRQVGRREQRAVGQAALDHQERVGPGEVLEGLGHRAHVALHEGRARSDRSGTPTAAGTRRRRSPGVPACS